MGNDHRPRRAGESGRGGRTDEPVWELPLDAVLPQPAGLGGRGHDQPRRALRRVDHRGACSSRSLSVGLPWAHIDIAGTAQADAASGWLNKGATGFGTRLLIDLCLGFTVPPASGARP